MARTSCLSLNYNPCKLKFRVRVLSLSLSLSLSLLLHRLTRDSAKQQRTGYFNVVIIFSQSGLTNTLMILLVLFSFFSAFFFFFLTLKLLSFLSFLLFIQTLKLLLLFLSFLLLFLQHSNFFSFFSFFFSSSLCSTLKASRSVSCHKLVERKERKVNRENGRSFLQGYKGHNSLSE